MKRFSKLWALGLGLFAAVLCGGCDVEFPNQEIRWRYDTEADALDVLIVYRGVTTPAASEEALDKGQAVADRILGGRREFMLMDWPFLFDLDADPKESEPLAAELRAAYDRVQLVAAGAFQDEDQRLCAYQHFRMTEVSHVLDGFNHLIGAQAATALDEGDLGPDDLPWFDEGEVEAWRGFIADRRPWIALEQGRLVLRAPITEAGAARALDAIVHQQDDEDFGFFANLSGITVADGVAEFAVGHVEGADTVVRLHRDIDVLSDLRDRLVTGGLDLAHASSLAEVRALLDTPSAKGN